MTPKSARLVQLLLLLPSVIGKHTCSLVDAWPGRHFARVCVVTWRVIWVSTPFTMRCGDWLNKESGWMGWTQRDQNKMAAIVQTIISHYFSSMKIVVIRLNFIEIPKGKINDKPALAQIIAWRPKWPNLQTHSCVKRTCRVGCVFWKEPTSCHCLTEKYFEMESSYYRQAIWLLTYLMSSACR